VNTPLFNAEEYDRQEYSQFGEDGLTLELVRRLDPPKWFVEVGCGNGEENNTRCLIERGWRGVWFDRDNENAAMARRYNKMTLEVAVNQETYVPLVPNTIGVLSIDVDGNDYWIWRGLNPQLNPSIVIIECQTQRPLNEPYVMPYDPEYVWDHASRDCGASLFSMQELGRELGYTFVGMPANPHSPNAFFVRNDLLPRLQV